MVLDMVKKNNYLICSKNKKQGKIGSDSSDLASYYELGWEMCCTHLYCKKLLHEGVIDKDWIIVTTRERAFLYETLFNKVIDYIDFLKESEWMIKNEIPFNIKDIVNETINHQTFFRSKWSPTIYDYRDILNIIQDVKLLPQPEIDTDFVIISIRKRDHASYRNYTDQFSKSLISQLKTKYKRIYLVGFGSEVYADNETTFYINLQEMATLCQHPRCKATITSGGTSYIPALLTKAPKLIVVDTNGHIDNSNPGNPLIFGQCIRFAETKYIAVPVSVEKIIENL